MAPACRLSGSMGGGFRKGIMASVCLSVCEKAVPQFSPWCQTLHFLPVCHWCLSSCYLGARAQREWVWASPCVGSLRGTAWNSCSFFHQLITTVFCIQKIWGLLFWAMELWNPGLGDWCGAGTPHSWYIPLKFIHHMWVWDQPVPRLHPSYQSNGCGFFNSEVVGLPFNLISDGSEWWLFYVLVVI